MALIGGGIGSVALIFFGGTALAFVAGVIIALVVRNSGWAWLSSPILALLVSAAIGWQTFRAAYSAAPGTGAGQVLNIDTAPGLPTLIFLLVVFIYLTFWIGMGTLAGREYRQFLDERRTKLAQEGTDSPFSS